MEFKQRTGFLVAGTAAESTGRMLRRLDADNKGNDDVAGAVVESVGNVCIAIGMSDDSKLRTAISAARAALDTLEEATQN